MNKQNQKQRQKIFDRSLQEFDKSNILFNVYDIINTISLTISQPGRDREKDALVGSLSGLHDFLIQRTNFTNEKYLFIESLDIKAKSKIRMFLKAISNQDIDSFSAPQKAFFDNHFSIIYDVVNRLSTIRISFFRNTQDIYELNQELVELINMLRLILFSLGYDFEKDSPEILSGTILIDSSKINFLASSRELKTETADTGDIGENRQPPQRTPGIYDPDYLDWVRTRKKAQGEVQAQSATEIIARAEELKRKKYLK